MRVFKQKILFTTDECNSIIESYSNLPADGHFSNKISTYDWIDLNKNDNRWILNRFIEWIEGEVNCKIKWDDNIDKDEFYFQTYNTGYKFGKHTDSIHNRIYTVGLLLNDSFRGGDFLVKTSFDNYELFENKIGNCYIIESMLEHELTEITEGTRNIILVFFKKSQVHFKQPMSLL